MHLSLQALETVMHLPGSEKGTDGAFAAPPNVSAPSCFTNAQCADWTNEDSTRILVSDALKLT